MLHWDRFPVARSLAPLLVALLMVGCAPPPTHFFLCLRGPPSPPNHDHQKRNSAGACGPRSPGWRVSQQNDYLGCFNNKESFIRRTQIPNRYLNRSICIER